MAALLGFFAVPAQATNFSGATGATGCGASAVNMADNETHSFFYVDVTSSTAAAVTYARTNYINPTNVNTVNDSANNATTDVIIRDQNYTTYCGFDWHPTQGGLIGLYTCDTETASGRCQHSTVRFDLSYIDESDATGDRWIACHELGHSLGLKHLNTSSGGCLHQSVLYLPVGYGTHNIGHINSNYP